MKINAIEIEEYHTEITGIKPCKYSDLPNVICLVGKNGSGKTRILKLLTEEIKSNGIYHFAKSNIDLKTTISKEKTNSIIGIESLAESRKILYGDKGMSESKGQNIYSSLIKNGKDTESYSYFISTKVELDKLVQNQIIEINYQKFKTLNQKREPSIKFLKEEVLLKNSNQNGIYRLNPIINLLNSVSDFNDSIESIFTSGIQYLEDLAKMLAYEKIKNFETPHEINNTVYYKKFESFKLLVNQLLAKNFHYVVDNSGITLDDNISGISGKWLLNGRKFDYSDLSDGEKVLFSFAFMLFLHEENNKIPIQESIIIIDEPETHLHPLLQVILIKRLKNILRDNGQLIIATHSIHIISALESEEIFLVEDNQLFPPSSKNISKIVGSLIGLGDDFDKFKDFCFEEFDWGFRNFIAQCFTKPDIINSAKAKDPQIALFKKAIKANNKISLLDFGCGSGRLGKEILKEIKEGKIDYYTYDFTDKYNDKLKEIGALEIYNEIDKIPKDKFDFVIACNVIHEIPLKDLLSELTIIRNSLKENGFVLIIEDKLLNKGETAHEDGFLLFTEEELPLLLDSNQFSFLQSEDTKYQNRIMCALIKKETIGKLDNVSLTKALGQLKENSYKKFNSIKVSNQENFKSPYEKGRISALYAQQYMNASFALDKLSNKVVKNFDEIEASFDGDWKEFLISELDINIGEKNNAPKGSNTVIVNFIIDNDGSITEVIPETDFGYGMEEEVVRVLNKSPKWKPASQNGKTVKAFRRQPVTFKIE
jgi:predicted ATPase/SAM-dependent methyltransferase